MSAIDNTVQIVKPKPINFTESAARKVLQLIEEEGNLKLNLRVYITGGGCSGFQYGFAFEETINPDDQIITRCVSESAANNEAKENNSGEGGFEVKLLIDPMSFQYLVGAEIDYIEDIEGERFVIRNPNAETTCGCGSSFSV